MKAKDSEGMDIPVVPEYTAGLSWLVVRQRYYFGEG